jgi:quercetin dioxygenase-like cupin family protein
MGGGKTLEKGIILRPEQEMKGLAWKKSAKGSPGVSIQDFLTKEENERVTVRYVKVEPGGHIIAHSHDVWEIFYMLEGKGEAEMGGRKEICSKGTCLIAPPGVRHSLKNIENVPVLLFCVFTPPLTE